MVFYTHNHQWYLTKFEAIKYTMKLEFSEMKEGLQQREVNNRRRNFFFPNLIKIWSWIIPFLLALMTPRRRSMTSKTNIFIQSLKTIWAISVRPYLKQYITKEYENVHENSKEILFLQVVRGLSTPTHWKMKQVTTNIIRIRTL